MGRRTKSERIKVCELIACSPQAADFAMYAFIGCAHETRATAPLSDVVAASRARRTGAEWVDAIENAATSFSRNGWFREKSVRLVVNDNQTRKGLVTVFRDPALSDGMSSAR